MKMADHIEEQQSEQLDLHRIAGIVRRRHLQFLIPLFLAWAVVWASSWVLPPRYKSVTTILVEQPTMPQNYVVPNVTDDLQTRLQSITTQVKSETRLLMIINRLHLYNSPQPGPAEEEKINEMRKAIDVELVRDPQHQDVAAFQISYAASDPRVAQRVAGELTDLFISENNKVRQQESQGTTNFLQQQLEAARQSLADQEAKVQQFEAQHEGALPTQQASNLQILAGLQSQLQNEQDALNSARQQRAYLQAMLQQQEAALNKARPSGADKAVMGPTDLAAVDERLDTLRGQLADLNSRYTDQYPDVLATKHEISRLQAERASIVAAEKAKSKEPKPSDLASSDEIDPILSGPVQQTRSQLQSNQLEIQNRESAINELKSRIGEYQGRLNAQPTTEQQLADLNRGYDQSKANYDDLLKKMDQSEMATSMEQMQQGERFTVLDPPSLPIKPDFPNRLKFCAAGFAIGAALGLLVAGAFEFLDDRLHSEKEIKDLLVMPVISEVPEVSDPDDEHKRKRQLLLGWAATAFVFCIILAGSVFSFLHN
ncbi:MAG: hypothetical protein ABSD70_08255 [Terracidiphilus sp.]|jgi:polysaccharide chain length determinant protein (PEP-CTERM system associated)